MNDKINVLIASGNEDLLKFIDTNLMKMPIISSVETVSDGIAAYNKIKGSKPDVAVIDGVMPKLDGLGLLEKLNGKGSTKIIMMSAIANENIVNTALSLGAEYYLLKPFDIEVLAARIEQLCRSVTVNKKDVTKNICYASKTDDMEIQITDILLSLGISPNLSGYKYNKEAIALVLDDETRIERITKEIYPDIAKKHHTTANRVERAIRHSIETMMSKYIDTDLMAKIFGNTISVNSSKPTNSQFIAAVAEYLRMNTMMKAC